MDQLHEDYQHEALDRTFTIQVMMTELLENHPYFEGKGKSRDLLSKMQELSCDLYQAIGNGK